jgi:hypothetical protein
LIQHEQHNTKDGSETRPAVFPENKS